MPSYRLRFLVGVSAVLACNAAGAIDMFGKLDNGRV